MVLVPPNHKAVPVDNGAETPVGNERRYRAEVEKSFSVIARAIEETEMRLSDLSDASKLVTRYYRADGTGDIWSDANAMDYTGQLGAVGACAQVLEGQVSYFVHNDQLWVYTGPRPASIGAGCSYTSVEEDYTPFGGLVQWDDIVGKPATFPPSPHRHDWDEIDGKPSTYPPSQHTHDWDEIEGKPSTYPPSQHTHVEADITDLNRMRWRNNWISGQTYQRNDQAWQGNYVGVANKETTDGVAPADVGDSRYIYEGTIGSISIPAKQVLFGVRYSSLTGGFRVEGWRMNVVAGNLYEVFLIDSPLSEKPIVSTLATVTPTVDGWREFYVLGNIVPQGTVFDVVVRVKEPDPVTVVYTLNYDYITPNNTANPVAGDIQHANKERDVLRVNKSDKGGDPTGQLPDGDPDGTPFDWTLFGVGDIIEGAGMRWSIQDVEDNGTWIGFTVAPADQGSDGNGLDFTFQTVIISQITVPRDDDLAYWDTVGYAGVSGMFFQDAPYDPTVTNRSAFGIDLLVQEVAYSPDWDLLPQMSANRTDAVGGGGQIRN